jgi:site-specific recombinase XerD
MRSPREFNQELLRRYMRWMVIQHYAVSTQTFYSQVLKAYCAFLQRQVIAAATHNGVLDFLASEASRGQSLQSLHHKLDILRVFYDCLRIGGVQIHSPARLIRLRPVRRQIPRVLSEDEVRKLIAHCRNRRDRVLIEILYGSGYRIFSHPETCSGDQSKISLLATIFCSFSWMARRQCLGRKADFQAWSPVSLAR